MLQQRAKSAVDNTKLSILLQGHAWYLMPFFCLQVFDFSVSCLTVVGYFSYLPDLKHCLAIQVSIHYDWIIRDKSFQLVRSGLWCIKLHQRPPFRIANCKSSNLQCIAHRSMPSSAQKPLSIATDEKNRDTENFLTFLPTSTHPWIIKVSLLLVP